ncbi:MAG: hypothetical protein V4819_26575 [Verrucomicrobiota bacterium]
MKPKLLSEPNLCRPTALQNVDRHPPDQGKKHCEQPPAEEVAVDGRRPVGDRLCVPWRSWRLGGELSLNIEHRISKIAHRTPNIEHRSEEVEQPPAGEGECDGRRPTLQEIGFVFLGGLGGLAVNSPTKSRPVEARNYVREKMRI